MAGWNKQKVSTFKAAFSDYLQYVVIDSKETGEGPIKLYAAQRRLLTEIFAGLEKDIHWFVILKARQLGMCYDPKMRVLTDDLRWVSIGDVAVGDTLIATDENGPGGRGAGRKMRRAVVEATNRVYEEAFRITMDNGQSLIATAQHRHLVKKRGGTEAIWKPVSWLRLGDEIRYITSSWDGDAHGSNYEDGWFGGLLDGEGSLRPKVRGGFEICVAQVPGAVLDRARKYLLDRGYHFREEIDNRKPGDSSKFGNKPVHKLVLSRMNEAFRLLGETKPSRFIEKNWWEGKDLPGKKSGKAWSRVVSIESLGNREMIDLQTSTKTFICEGFVSHNSTIVRALIVFWAYMHPGLRVALVFDSNKNAKEAREEIRLFLSRLPKSHSIPITNHPRDFLQLSNGSRVSYLVAGTKKTPNSGGLGRSLGFNCCGCTEMSSWADIEGLRAFERSLAQKFENRLFIWESTARGFNIFHDLWKEAKADDLTKKAIFIGWWAKELYTIDKDTPLFQRYGLKLPSDEEQQKIDIVRERYGHEITMEQLAWYRHEYDPDREAYDEREHAGQDIITQELPWYEEEAFLKSGSDFFPNDRLSLAMRDVARLKCKGYNYYMSEDFLATLMEPVDNTRKAMLKVWEEPDPTAQYVIGADPAFGSNEDSDRFAAQVLRCYADGLDQVAEFTTTRIVDYQFAWALAHLCGAYGNARLLIELNGPGHTVWNEFRTLEILLTRGYMREAALERGLTNIFDHVRQYLWYRQDSLSKNPTMFQWETNAKRKEQIMTRLRDLFHLGQIKIRSFDCLEEMSTMVRDQGSIHGEGTNHDDRVMALALAARAWDDSERKKLIAQDRTRENEARRRNLSPLDMQAMFHQGIVESFFQRQKTGRIRAARAAKRGRRWNW